MTNEVADLGFVPMAAEALERAREVTARAQARENALQTIYSRAIELFDKSGRYPTGEEVMASFSEAEADQLIEDATEEMN